jgi:hypothetical protein
VADQLQHKSTVSQQHPRPDAAQQAAMGTPQRPDRPPAGRQAAVRAQLLRMIIQNEAARKSKTP